MSSSDSRISQKAGASPGTLIHIGDQKAEDFNIRHIRFSADSFKDAKSVEPGEISRVIGRGVFNWLIVTGLHEVEQIETTGQLFDIHPLTLEDILNTAQRPKIEFFDHYFSIILKLPLYDGNEIRDDQVSMVVGKDFLLMFEERPSDVFTPVIDRLRNGKGRIRKSGCDYLAYAVIDLIVDCGFPILETLGDQIERIEESLTSETAEGTINDLHLLKRNTIQLRKLLWPLRELIGRMKKEDSELIADTTRPFLNDVNDHAVQILDTVESYKDMLSGLTDLYLSVIGNKTNEAMKVLTIIATIFIPMTFIVGVYGMNFKHMPELDWQWGYLFVWALIVAVAAAMVVWFKRKKLL